MVDVAHKLRLVMHDARLHWKPVLLGLFVFCVLFLYLKSWLDNGDVYKVIFDAGSTGTRVHVFKFKVPRFSLRNTAVVAEEDLSLVSIPLFEKLSGGLSDYASNVKASRKGLDELIDKAKGAIPETNWANTEVIFLATAGLRLLQPSQASALLSEVKDALAASGFQVGLVDTIDGQLEAKLMYTMTHFVTNTDDNNKEMAIVDLGGGSVQLAYQSRCTDDSLVSKFLQKSSNRSLLYLNSWLGYGLVAFRLKALEAGGVGVPHPCVPVWTPAGTQYTYGEKVVDVISSQFEKNVDACATLVRQALNNNDDAQCKKIKLSLSSKNSASCSGQCGLNGVWLGPSDPKGIPEWRLFSYIFDLAQEEGMVKPGVSEGFLSARDFLNSAKKHCQAQEKQDRIEWWKCVDLVYVSVLLTDGFRLDPDFPLLVTKHLTYKGEIELEAAWPLGAAIASLRNEL
jgi:hypothetical protein